VNHVGKPLERAALVVFAALAGGACSVPGLSLEGKQCPCSDGYVCDELTNRCLATNDGGGIIDSPAATQCLPSPGGETEVYRYTGTFDWLHEHTSWTAMAGEIRQTSSSAQNSYTYKTSAELIAAPNIRVISTMRETTAGNGTPAFGIVLRAQLSSQDKSRYTCNWVPKDRQLRIEVQSGGGSPTLLGAAAVTPATALPASLTMEAAIDGSTLACCIRELPAARLTGIQDPAMVVATGYPGVSTHRMAAAFGSFVVFHRP
jgi:hypothetical protein